MRVALLLLAFILLSPIGIVAQRRGEALVSGRVLDTRGRIIDFATVVLKGTKRSGTTNSQGLYHINAPAGNYTVRVQALGYEAAE